MTFYLVYRLDNLSRWINRDGKAFSRTRGIIYPFRRILISRFVINV